MAKPIEVTPAPGLERGDDPLEGTSYRAIRTLGKGGMGEVFLAEHVQLRKRCVVKLLHDNLSSHPKHVDRIRIEAEALGRLHHPSIVEVRDFGMTPSGRPLIVMERLLGATLHQELREKGYFEPREAIRYVRQVLSALAAAHALGIVHRDIKLDNIFIHQPPGAPRIAKVLDFGIAKILDGVSERAPKPMIPTDEGVIVGTPRYVSPEAALGKPVDHRADIYSVGLVLYALLAGRGPWDDEKREGMLIMAQATKKPSPPSTYAPKPISPELEQIVMRALEKNPADRFQSAEAFDQALERVATKLSTPIAYQDTELHEPGKPVTPTLVAPLEGDVHATLIDEPLFGSGGDTETDQRSVFGAPVQEAPSSSDLRPIEGPSATEVLIDDRPEPESTRTASTSANRDPTELRVLEAALRRNRPAPSPIRVALASVAIMLLLFLGWLVVRLVSG